MRSITTLPRACNSFVVAREEALLESKRYGLTFVYLIKNNSGVYIIDYLKPQYDDERIIKTYLNGQEIL